MVKKSRIHIKTVLLVSMTILFGPSIFSFAQESSSPFVTINSNPSGAVVHLEGEYQFIGRTPFVVPYTVVGQYNIKASKLGFQKLQRTVTFSGNVPSNVQLGLLPKTRLKSVGRSLFVPGWGQFYSDRKTVGVVYSTFAALSLISLIRTHQDYLIASRDYENALGKVQLGGFSYADRLRLYEDVDSEWKNLQQTEDMLYANIAIVAGVWVLNIIDSFFFFPNYSREIEVFEKFSLNAVPFQQGVGLSLNYTLN